MKLLKLFIVCMLKDQNLWENFTNLAANLKKLNPVRLVGLTFYNSVKGGVVKKSILFQNPGVGPMSITDTWKEQQKLFVSNVGLFLLDKTMMQLDKKMSPGDKKGRLEVLFLSNCPFVSVITSWNLNKHTKICIQCKRREWFLF